MTYQTYENYLKESGLSEAEFWSTLTGGDRNEPIWIGDWTDRYINSHKHKIIGYETLEDQWRGLWGSSSIKETIDLAVRSYMYSYENVFDPDRDDGYLHFVYTEKCKGRDPVIFVYTTEKEADGHMYWQGRRPYSHGIFPPADLLVEELRKELRNDDRLVIDFTSTDEPPVKYGVTQDDDDELLLVLDYETISHPWVLAFLRRLSRLLDEHEGYQIASIELSDDPRQKPFKATFEDPDGNGPSFIDEWRPSIVVFKERVADAYKEYINGLYGLSIDEVLTKAKEKVILEELAIQIEDSDFCYIEEEEAEVLLTLSDPLKDLYVDYDIYRSYEEWDFRGGYNDIEEFLQEVVRELKREEAL